MDTTGHHFIIESYGCSESRLNSGEWLEKEMSNIVNQVGMNKLSSHFHPFYPEGVTGVIVLSTSHFSIHTWPEKKYAALDLYTCGDTSTDRLWKAIETFTEQIGAQFTQVYYVPRGNKTHSDPILRKQWTSQNKDNRLTTQMEHLQMIKPNQSNEWDIIQLKEILSGEHHVHYQGKSPFQDIFIVEANDLRLYLDYELQFSSIDERYYHEALVHPAMSWNDKRERVLILGGGDGLALREVLKYPDVQQVELVDIDPVVLEAARTVPALTKQNNRAFFDSRVTVHVKDANAFIEKCQKQYDVIIIDFPDPVDEVIAELYTKEMFEKIARRLSKTGTLVCQSNSTEDTPIVFWSIAKTMEAAGLFTLPYERIVPSFGIWGFHLAAHQPLKEKMFYVPVPHQALPDPVTKLFQLTNRAQRTEPYAVVHTKKQSQLHDIYQKEIRNLNR
ncbi:adenosylmethionine decarboxylase [Aeribacillus pallidus]|uniref:adenosylmethionine decarboxylase n=1 Tax=Aeribacillus pallidus TaxID=33936 RepID=UPI003D1B475C